MTVARKLAASFGIVLLLMVILDVVVWINTGRVHDRFQWVIERNGVIVANARHLETLVVGMEAGQKGFDITQDDEFLESFERGHEQFHQLLDDEKKLLSNRPAEMAVLAEIERLHKEWIERAVEPEVAAARQATDGDLRNVAALLRTGIGKDILDQTKEELGKLIELRIDRRAARYAEAAATAQATRRMIFILGFAALVLGAVAALAIARSITAAVSELAEGAEAVGRGELDHRVHVKSRDELGQLAAAFNNMGESRKQAEGRIEHLNQLLRAIRNINQLIVREKDRERLLDKACRLLVETRGYHNAWIALVEDGKPVHPFHPAGFGGDSAPMVEQLLAGGVPRCARMALETGEIQVVADPVAECRDCPLSPSYGGRGGLTVPLQHDGRVFGWLAVSVPAAYAGDAEEHELLAELATDLSYGLHSIETEKAREESERTLRAIFDSASDGILLADAETRKFVKANEAMGRMLGYTVEELEGLSLADIHPAGSLARASAEFEMLRRGEIALAPDIPVKRKDGSVFFADVSTASVDLGGRAHLVGIFRDITERKQAEEALRQERDRAQKYLDIAGVMFVAVDAKGEVTLINQKGSEILGYGQEEVIGTNWLDRFVPVSVRDQVRTVDDQLMAGAIEPFEYYENPVVTKGGEERIIAWHNTTLRDDEGNTIGILSSGEDITERRRAEERVQEAFDIINRSPVCAFTWRNEVGWPVDFASDNVKEVFGFTAEDFTSSAVPYLQVVHPDDLERVGQELEAHSSEADCHELTYEPYRIIRADGAMRWVSDWTSIVRDERGRVTHYKSIIEDITERISLEQQLRQSQKMEAIGRLAGGVAHDFNNLLTGIKGFVKFALKGTRPGSQANQDLTEVLTLSDRATDLTRQLLAFSRRQTLEAVVLDLNTLLADRVKMLARLLGEDIDIQFVAGADLGNVRADPGQIEQVIMNLAVNARDVMPDGGKLTIETANVQLNREYTNTHAEVEPGPYVMTAVSDTGHGMDEETQARIFDPFFTTKELPKGTGLGLSTVYGIVKQHGGSIWVYSEEGKGTTFKVYLPRVAAEAEERGPKSEFVGGGAETILLVEDDAAVRDIGRRYLDALGYTVLCAASAREAEDIAQGHEGRIDMLLTDVVMPDRNGRELYEAMVARHPDLKVLYMSGYTGNSIVHHGVLEAGIPFLQKPFEREDLAAKVRRALDG